MPLTKKEISARYLKKKKQKKIDETFILNEGETFTKIKGNENYYLTDKGRIFSTITCSFLNPYINKCGYKIVCLSNRKRHTLHRLLALHFIPNPLNLPVVDHIDRNRINNNLDNLRWVNCSDNSKNRSKGSIHKRYTVKKTVVYEAWRVYYYVDDKKKSKTFKNYDDAVLFHNKTKIV